MKLIVGLFAFMTTLIVVAYVMVFTSFGHGILLPIAESSIEKNLKIKDAKFTNFSLSTNSIDTTLTLDSQPIHIEGKFNIIKKLIDLTYDIKIDDLSIFNDISKQKLQGKFQTNGKVIGVLGNIGVQGKATFADGKTDYELFLKEDGINNIQFALKDLLVEKLLWMVSQPQYTTGLLNIEGTIKSLSNLDGDILTKLTKGVLNSDYINKTFAQKLPKNATYEATINTKLAKENITSIVDFNSFVAQLDTTKTTFNIPSGKLTSDYILDIPSLNALYFVTNQKLKGGITIDGDITFDKTLLATFNSKKFDGTLKGKLDNNKLNVQLDNIQSTKLLDMLYYPEIFKSNIKLDLDYDITTKKGLSKLSANNGQFLTNQTTQMLKQFTQYDLTMEIYDVTNLTTKIDNTNLENDLYMKSKNSEIKSKVFIIDTAKSTINADLILKYRKYDMGLKLQGAIADPKVKLDIGKTIENKAKEKIKEKLNETLKEKLKDENIGNILNQFFK
jgi:hypothetical protein